MPEVLVLAETEFFVFLFVSFSVNRELKILSWIINTIPLLGEELKKMIKKRQV